MNGPPKNLLAYRAPDRGGPGCRRLISDIFGGMCVLGVFAAAAGALGSKFSGWQRVASMSTVFTLAGSALVFVALQKRPGFLIGYVIAGGVFLFLNLICGSYV